MPHYIPQWLRGHNSTASGDDDISWYFQDYRHGFDSPLADVVFDIMLSLLAKRMTDENCSSEQLLLVFQESAHRERHISRMEHAANARQALQHMQKHSVSFIGTPISSIETSAILVCLVSKIAQELAVASQSPALGGLSSDVAECILDNTMYSHKWAEFFFSTLLRLRGKGHLAVLLNRNGALHNFDWTSRWKVGVVSLRHNITNDLTHARDSFLQSRRDIAQFSQQYRACPFCKGAFGVDQRNCGQFTCGRDAHGVNGQPAIGGRAIRETHGCGRNFTLDQALPYNQSRRYIEDDLPALRSLEEDLAQKERAFNAFNQSTELWQSAEQFHITRLSFHVRSRGINAEVFPNANLIDYVSGEQPEVETDPEIQMLVRILDQLPGLDQISYLPDMIELYIFVHRIFRHVLTKDMAMNMTIRSVLEEHLLSARFGSIDASRIRAMWLRATEGINNFLNANGSVVQWNCERITVPFPDITNATVIACLSEMEDPTEGHDYLFLVINEIILRYNNLMKSISSFIGQNSNSEAVHEINPRTIVPLSKNAVTVTSVVSTTEKAIDELVESYWSKDDDSFLLVDLLRAIRLEMMAHPQTIKSPMTFLREKFSFRESISVASLGSTHKACFRSSDGLYFVRNSDISLYEEVFGTSIAMGFSRKTQSIAHTLMLTFQTFSYTEWLTLLEGLRNLLGHLRETQFTNDNNQLGNMFPELESFGFPQLDEAQSTLLNSIQTCDILDVICVCGEQLSSEAYRYVGLPRRLAEPLPLIVKDSIRDGVVSNLGVEEIETFSMDVLDFYCDRLIVPASESSNQSFVDFLRENNCCNDTDTVFDIIPESVTIRNYIDVQKVLYQAKLQLLSSCAQVMQLTSPQDALSGPNSRIGTKASKWKWSTKRRSQEQKYHWSAFGDLWFEEAFQKSLVNSLDSKDNSSTFGRDGEMIDEDTVVVGENQNDLSLDSETANYSDQLEETDIDHKNQIEDSVNPQGLDHTEVDTSTVEEELTADRDKM